MSEHKMDLVLILRMEDVRPENIVHPTFADGTHALCSCGWREDLDRAPVEWPQFYAWAAGYLTGAAFAHLRAVAP